MKIIGPASEDDSNQGDRENDKSHVDNLRHALDAVRVWLCALGTKID